jgi:CBS domain-containing protein
LTRLGTLENALEDVGGAGDAARLQIHLLSLEARKRTGELSLGIEALEHKLDRGLEQAMSSAANKTRQLTQTVQEYLGLHPPDESFRRSSSIMTEPARTCSRDEPLSAAAKIMWDTDCGAVLVVDADGRLCGILTDRDICMAAYTKGAELPAIRVADAMSVHVHTSRPEDSIERAVAIMADAQVRRVPVVDADGRPARHDCASGHRA